MPTFIGYPKIGQYRNVVQGLSLRERYVGRDENDEPIYDPNKKLPSITFHGSVKLHGTNSGIGNLGDEIWFQSRTNIVTPTKDNNGFAASMSSNAHTDWLKDTFCYLRSSHCVSDDEIIVIFGEWCGGSIQKGVALNELDKRFVIFDVRVVGEERDDHGNFVNDRWLPIDGIRNHSLNVYNIHDYTCWEIEIDLNEPESAIEKLDALTAEVGKECPFAKAFDVSGTGEGIVWKVIYEGSRYAFKIKDEAHKNVKSKKKKTALDPEKVASIKEFVDYSVTENRLNQAIEQVFTINNEEPTIKGTGNFLKWLVNDIVTEEIETLSSSGLSAKEVSGEISKKGREWFFKYLDGLVFGNKGE